MNAEPFTLNQTIMTAYQSAVQDIQNECDLHSKCFIAFRTELNPVMDKIVKNAIKEQEGL